MTDKPQDGRETKADPEGEMYRLALLVTVQDMTKVYVQFAVLSKSVLSESTLVQAPG